MPRPAPDPSRRRPIDWRGWLALGWALWFGALYALMLLQHRAPGVLHALRSASVLLRPH